MDKEGHFDIRTPVLNHIIHGNIQNQQQLFLCLQIHMIYSSYCKLTIEFKELDEKIDSSLMSVW